MLPPLLAAFLAPVIAVPAVLIAWVAAWDFNRYGGDFRFSWAEAVRQGLGMSMYAVVIAWVITFSAGLFVHRVLRETKRTRWWHYATTGAIIGAVPFALFALSSMFGSYLSVVEVVRRGIWPATQWLLIGMACGAATATIFRALVCDEDRPMPG